MPREPKFISGSLLIYSDGMLFLLVSNWCQQRDEAEKPWERK